MTDRAARHQAVAGESGVAALVDRLYERVLADAKIAAFFARSDVEELKRHQHDFLSAALHGTDAYRGRSMREAHAGRGITEADFDRLLAHLAEAMEDEAIERATAIALIERLEGLRSEVTTG